MLKKAIEESLKLENEKQKHLAKDCMGVTYKNQKDAKGRGKRNRGGRKSAQVQQESSGMPTGGQESARKSAKGSQTYYRPKKNQ